MRSSRPLLSLSLGSTFVFLMLQAAPSRADLPSADRALQEGRVGEAAEQLRSWLQQHPSDASAHLLLCRGAYGQDMIDPALSACESAAEEAPQRSDIQLWLGRSYGMKASAANPLSAFSIARKVRDAFDRSVRLDPANVRAMSDLGEFYVAAPAIVGGGAGKARNLAARLANMERPDAQAIRHRILAMLAEKENDPETAEAEFRKATQGSSPAAWIDLAAFYARRREPDRAVAAVKTGVELDRSRDATLVDAASVLVEVNRNLDLAGRLLRDYLASGAKSDDAPAFRVHLKLGDLLTRAGDLVSARREYAAALALAPEYAPAKKKAVPASPENR